MRSALVCLTFALCLWSVDAEGSYINYPAREINVKVVYDGPAAPALAASLHRVHASIPARGRGKLRTLPTDAERVTLFDFVPAWLGKLHGFDVRTHVYVATGSTDEDATRRLVLKGADALIFVASDDPARVAELKRSWESIKRHLRAHGHDWRKMPLVVQLDRAGAATSMSEDQVRSIMGLVDQPIVPTSSTSGAGVLEAFKASSRQVFIELERGANEPAPKPRVR
jgi:hypothetical protein